MKIVKCGESTYPQRRMFDERMRSKVGQKLGRLKLIEYVGRFQKQPCFSVVCDCGESEIIKYSIFRKEVRHSRGCFKCLKDSEAKKSFGNKSHTWRGCGELPMSIMSQIKNGAKDRGLEVTVNIEYLWDLFLKQNRKCALSGLLLTFPTKYESKEGSASLDRKDSSRGYTEDNVQWVHKTINRIKLVFEQEIFIKICNLVAGQHKRENIDNIEFDKILMTLTAEKSKKVGVRSGASYFKLEKENGEIFYVYNMRIFCKNNNLGRQWLRNTQKHGGFYKGIRLLSRVENYKGELTQILK